MDEGGRGELWIKTVSDGIERKISMENERKKTDNNNTVN